MIFNSTKSHFGYFSVNNFRTFSRSEALELQHKLGHPVQYHFNDDVYGSIDWSIEPLESIQDLYFQRARQIREKYDYLVLMFSGGADSYNVLMSFVHAGVKLDEIAHLTYYKADKDKKSFMNREIFETAYPTALELKKNNPVFKDTVIREIDLTDLTAEVMSKKLYDFDYYANALCSPWHATRTFIREKLSAYKKMCAERRVVFIHGAEKIHQIQFRKGHFYYAFHECTSETVNARVQHLAREEEHDEFFYCTPDAPLITIKQCHLIKKFLKQAPVPHPWLSRDVPRNQGHISKWHDGAWHTYFLTLEGLHSIVYPWYDPKLYVERKIQNMLYSDRDAWVFRDTALRAKHDGWIHSMMTRFGPDWLQNPAPGVYHAGHLYSRSYCFGK